ncbi:MAG: ROK family transcriptional regulator [Myxococcota bacterium]
MDVIGSSDIRARNSSLMLKLMWEQKQISRAEIARQMGLSRSTVSSIVNNLMGTGLLRTCGSGESIGGRRPILLGFADDAFFLVGVEIGATHVGVALTNLRAEVLVWRHAHHPVRDDPQGTLRTLVAFVHECVEEAGTSLEQVVGVGIGVPSPVDPEDPVSMSPLIHPRWSEVNVAQSVGQLLDVPIFIDNDANLGALAERWWGEGRDGRDLAYIKVATGIGAGYIIHGKIYRGAGGFAGEIGHTTISTDDRMVSLQSLIGTQALIARAKHLLDQQHPNSLLAGSEVTLQALIEATRAGDLLCRQLIDETGAYLGIAIANLLNLLNPATIVLGGALASLDDLLLHPIRQAIRDRTLWATIAQSRLVTSSIGKRAIAVGAATRVLEAALDNHQLFPALRARSSN